MVFLSIIPKSGVFSYSFPENPGHLGRSRSGSGSVVRCCSVAGDETGDAENKANLSGIFFPKVRGVPAIIT